MLSNLDIYSMETEDHVHARWTRVSAGGQVTVASRRAGDRTSRVARSYILISTQSGTRRYLDIYTERDTLISRYLH